MTRVRSAWILCTATCTPSRTSGCGLIPTFQNWSRKAGADVKVIGTQRSTGTAMGESRSGVWGILVAVACAVGMGGCGKQRQVSDTATDDSIGHDYIDTITDEPGDTISDELLDLGQDDPGCEEGATRDCTIELPPCCLSATEHCSLGYWECICDRWDVGCLDPDADTANDVPDDPDAEDVEDEG